MKRIVTQLISILFFSVIVSLCAFSMPSFADEEDHGEFQHVWDQYQNNKDSIDQKIANIAAKKDFPVIYVTTDNRSAVTSRETYVSAVVDVFNCDPEYELTACSGIKIRGNSTAKKSGMKPYRLKFENKENVLGLHQGRAYKSWVLLRSSWNMATDYTAFALAKTIFKGEYYSSDYSYVNLFINDQFMGIYVLCEQNQVANGRVEIKEPKGEEAPDEIGYFVELDNYAYSEKYHFTMNYNQVRITDLNGTNWLVIPDDYSIKSEITTTKQAKFIEKYMNGVYKITYEGCINNKAYEFDENYEVVPSLLSPQFAVAKVVDLNSAVDMLILHELVHDNDLGSGSFFMAIDFSEDSLYKRLTFTAPWDFNWGYSGDPMAGYVASTFQYNELGQNSSNAWYVTLMGAKWFRNRVIRRWRALEKNQELQNTVYEVQETVKLMENDLDTHKEKVKLGLDVTNYVLKRIEWLNGVWGE